MERTQKRGRATASNQLPPLPQRHPPRALLPILTRTLALPCSSLQVGFEAIGIVDSKLKTYGVWASPKTAAVPAAAAVRILSTMECKDNEVTSLGS